MPRKIEDPRVQKERLNLPAPNITSELLSKNDLINSTYATFSIPSKSGSQVYPKILEIMKRHTYIEDVLENSMFYVVGFENLDTDLITFWKLLPRGWKVLGIWINGDEFDCNDHEQRYKIDQLITCEDRGKCNGICSHDIGFGGLRGISIYTIRELFDEEFQNPIQQDLYFRDEDKSWRLRQIYRDYSQYNFIERDNDKYTLKKEVLKNLADELLLFERKYCSEYNQDETIKFIENIPTIQNLKTERYEGEEEQYDYVEERRKELEEERKMYMKLADDILDKLEKKIKKLLTEFGDKYLRK